MTNQKNNECCPEFEVERWDGRTITWDAQPCIKESIPTFFHMPFPPVIGWKITKMYNAATKANALPKNILDALVLFHDPSAFRSELYMFVTKAVPGVENVTLSGTFATKVFDGPYNAIPRFLKQMEVFLEARGKTAKDHYVHYAYCPKCAKKFGRNYMVIFAEI